MTYYRLTDNIHGNIMSLSYNETNEDKIKTSLLNYFNDVDNKEELRQLPLSELVEELCVQLDTSNTPFPIEDDPYFKNQFN